MNCAVRFEFAAVKLGRVLNNPKRLISPRVSLDKNSPDGARNASEELERLGSSRKPAAARKTKRQKLVGSVARNNRKRSSQQDLEV
jgi:hypothetical protein